MIDSARPAFHLRKSLERQAASLGGRPDRHHAVAVLAQDQARHLGGRNVDRFGDQAAEPCGIELSSQPDDLAGRQIEPLDGQVSQHINGIGDDEHDRHPS